MHIDYHDYSLYANPYIEMDFYCVVIQDKQESVGIVFVDNPIDF